MKIDLRKLPKEKREFSLDVKDGEDFANFTGCFYLESPFLVVDGRIHGQVNVICDTSGEWFADKLDEDVKIKVIEGSYKGFDELYDIIEVDGDIFDVELFIKDEMELFRNDYHKKVDSSPKELIIENL